MKEHRSGKPTLYGLIGGSDGIHRLVQRFYALMDHLPEAYTVRQIHPEDLSHAATTLHDFLSGWLGGPQLYVERHGHPRLRMRHLPYRIGPAERDEWMLCMRQALHDEVADPKLRHWLQGAFEEMATHMINVGEGHACAAP